MNRKGASVVFEPGNAYKEVGTGALGEITEATPAFGDSVIYIRTNKHLVAIAKKAAGVSEKK